jgi:hypothetical protein
LKEILSLTLYFCLFTSDQTSGHHSHPHEPNGETDAGKDDLRFEFGHVSQSARQYSADDRPTAACEKENHPEQDEYPANYHRHIDLSLVFFLFTNQIGRLSRHSLPLFPGALKHPGSDGHLLDAHKPFQRMPLRLPMDYKNMSLFSSILP